MPSDTRLPADTLVVERRGKILVVRLARPAKRNALSDGMIEAIDTVFSGAPDDIGAIVLHGEGANFSAGLDLAELTERDAVQGLMHSRMWHRALDRIQFGKAPVIAALQGAVIGGGLDWPAPRTFVWPNPRFFTRCPKDSAASLSAAALRCVCRASSACH